MGTAKEPIICGDEIRWYYNGTEMTHGTDLDDRIAAIGLAKWRLDGFVSLDGESDGGVVETVPLNVPPSQLEINANASSGNIQIEILTADRQVQDGFLADACQVMKGDSVRYGVGWAGKTFAQAEQPLRLRLLTKNSALYAFRLKPIL